MTEAMNHAVDPFAWAAAGNQIFLVQHESVSVGRIQKVTARDIVLESGDRFPRATRSKARGPFDRASIASIDDPDVLARFRAQTAQRRAASVAFAADAFRTHPNEETAAGVEAALTKWREAAARL
jgi:hypothetical protein